MSSVTVQLSTPDGRPYDPIWAENKPQQAFHASPAKFRLLRGGGGGGKTLAGVIECVLTMLEYPGTEGMIARYNYPQLEKTTWRDFVQVSSRAQLIKTQSRAKGMLSVEYHNGSKCWGINLADIKSVTSLNLGFAMVDECTEIKNTEAFRQAMLRLRHPAGPGKMWVVGYTGGRDWLQELFTENKGGRFAFFPICARDNLKNLPPSFESDLRASMPRQWADQYLDGRIDQFRGLVFPEFNRDGIHVFSPFPIPHNWPRFRAIDHGFADPTCCLWGATDNNGALYIYDEYYESGRTISQNAPAITEKTGIDEVEWTVLDRGDAHKHDSQTGKTNIDEYMACGITPLMPADNRKRPGITRILQLLYPDETLLHPFSGASGSPKLFISTRCPNLIRELHAWKWKEQRIGGIFKPEPEDGADGASDHAISALRFLCLQMPRPALGGGTRNAYLNMLARLEQVRLEAAELRGGTIDYDDIIGNSRATKRAEPYVLW